MTEIVSIIIPIYNGEKTVERTINSILNQTETNVEILIVDNASNDDSKKIIKGYNDSRVKYIYTSKKGRSLARNIGLKKAKGKYILFLDADDTLSKDRIAKGVQFLESNITYFAHATSVEYINDITNEKSIFTPNVNELAMLYNNQYPINSIMFQKTDSQFDETLEFNEDWLFFLNVLRGKKIYLQKDYIGGHVYIHGNNTMSNSYEMLETKLVVRNQIKKQYKGNIRIHLDDLKLLLYYFILANYYEKKLDLSIVNSNFKVKSKIAKFLLNTPIIGAEISKKSLNRLLENQYLKKN